MTSAQIFTVYGSASDAGNGLDKATFSTAFGNTPPEDTTPAAWLGNYGVESGSRGSDITVTLYDKAGNSAVQDFFCFLDATPPVGYISVPKTTTQQSFIVNWSAKDSASGLAAGAVYTMQYRVDEGAWQDWIANTASTSAIFGPHTPISVAYEHFYHFRVTGKAVDNVGNQADLVDESSTWVELFKVYLPLLLRNWPPVPDVPTLNPIEPNPACNAAYTVSWNQTNLADGYVLEKSTNSNFSDAKEIDLTDTSYSASGKTAGHYYYRVKAYNSVGSDQWFSAWSNVESAEVLAIPDVPLLNPITNSDDNGDYAITWNVTNLATSYVLQEAVKVIAPADSDYKNIYTGSDAAYSVTGKGAGRYYYRVKANNACGASGGSNVQSVDVLWEAEPNDDALAQANGPIVSGLTYHGQFLNTGDPKDYFYFEMSEPHAVDVWLTNVLDGNDYNIILRDEQLLRKGYSANPGNDHIQTGVLPAGRYYIQVINYSGSGSSQEYYLRVVYH